MPPGKAARETSLIATGLGAKPGDGKATVVGRGAGEGGSIASLAGREGVGRGIPLPDRSGDATRQGGRGLMPKTATAGFGRMLGAHAKDLLRKAVAIPAWPALALLIVIAAIEQPRLLSLPFLLIILRQSVPLALTAIGQSLPMIGRSIDLSVGGVIAVTNVTLALPAFAAGPAWMSLAFPLVLGATIGMFNAVLIAFVRASAVVVTLGVSVMLVGTSYLISGGAPGGAVHPLIRWIATGRWGTFPVAGIVLLVIAIVAAVMLRRSVFGHALSATGASYGAAWLGGISVRKELVVAHVLCGICAGIAGIMLTGYIGTGTLNLGADLVMASVAAVVLGGTTFGASAGGVGGVFAGAIALTFLANLMTGMGVGKPAQLIVQGLIIAGAAALARLRAR
ncbi:ABC transporter permease [Sinirhodobacter populi]|uniref:ABC transporter permease n=2 Tax=Paenirhodobacter populi TaxID=2306993 RepID=A0A443J4C6_9RHOB|nr:ABC transporter permease [Sinirhodobacter populi]